MSVIESRLAYLGQEPLLFGSHERREDGVCALEAVAWLAGEEHTDHPRCVCPVIGAFVRSWNDGLPTDADRDRLLKPLLPLLIGTASTLDVQDRRAFMAADWAVRVFTPAWLRLAGLTAEADELRSLPELGTVELCLAAMPAIGRVRRQADAAQAAAQDAAQAAAQAAARDAAQDAAWDAARDAAGAAARAAAWDAARDAARDAAGDAARDAAWAAAGAAARAAAQAAARDAARDAAGAAARAAAQAAARDAARDALAGTVAELQRSAADLVARMCEEAR